MPIGIRQLKGAETHEVEGEDASYRRFMSAFIYALSYAPDRQSHGLYRDLEDKFREHFGALAGLQEKLEQEFFLDLYIDRIERLEALSLLPTMRPIILFGLIGSGKTVVLKKIDLDSLESGNDFYYYDLKADSEIGNGTPSEEFRGKFRERIYNYLLKAYVEEADYVERREAWTAYMAKEDPGMSEFRELVIAMHPHAFDSLDSWGDAFRTSDVQDLFRERYRRPELRTLLRFLKSCGLKALCLDNVDAFPIERQRAFLSEAIHISNEGEIAVIVAIRDSNLSRLVSEGENGDWVIKDELPPLRVERNDAVAMKSLSEYALCQLLDRRIGFVEKHVGKDVLESILSEDAERHGLVLAAFKDQFWRLMHLMGKTFVEQGVYDTCNHNLRSMLILYFRFLTRILVNPDKHYSLKDLTEETEKLRITRLRTYFYRWLLLGGRVTKYSSSRVINVLEEPQEPELHLLPVRVLSFLYNQRVANQVKRWQYKTLCVHFERFGVSQESLSTCLRDLAKPQGTDDLGLVWLDTDTEDGALEETAIVEILPSGSFFLEETSVSREYAFWAAMLADLPCAVVTKRFTEDATYSAQFKLDVVLRLLKDHLVPNLRRELEALDGRIKAPAGYGSSNLSYFRDQLAMRRELYARRLQKSVQVTVEYSGLDSDTRRKYHTEFNKIGQDLAKLERKSFKSALA